MTAPLKIGRTLWSLPLPEHPDSRKIRHLMQNTPEIGLSEFLFAPNADIWTFRFMGEPLILVNDLCEGADIRFRRRESQTAAECFARLLAASV